MIENFDEGALRWWIISTSCRLPAIDSVKGWRRSRVTFVGAFESTGIGKVFGDQAACVGKVRVAQKIKARPYPYALADRDLFRRRSLMGDAAFEVAPRAEDVSQELPSDIARLAQRRLIEDCKASRAQGGLLPVKRIG